MSFVVQKLSDDALNCKDPSMRECLNSCSQGFYINDKAEKVQLTDLINNCLEKTEFYDDNHEYNICKQNNKENGIIEVRKESTLQTAYRFCSIENKKNVCALNFANSIMPGGLVLFGVTAQEESLCRSSALYYSLIQEKATKFYKYHIDEKKEEIASNSIIFTPNCPTWIIEDRKLDQPILVSYITSAAVNTSCRLKKEEIRDIHDKRINAIIDCAIENNVKNIILGAFGCGVFNNDPFDIANSFKKCLVDEKRRYYFESISFSILGDEQLNTFKEIFDSTVDKKCFIY